MLKNISNSRKQQLEELKSFTDAVNKEIADIVGLLNWTVDSITDVDQEYFTCPYEPSHRLTEESLNDHLVSCQWKAEGYGKSDIPLSEPTLAEDSPFSIKFDEALQADVLRKAHEQNPTMKIGTGERLIPRTSDRLVTDFTSNERRALYDYVIAHTEKPDIGQDIADINNLKPQETKDKELSSLQLLVQERNLKRRRPKHRGVHTNKKSHTEILREVINQQMETYADYISEQTDPTQATDVQSFKTKESNYEMTQDRAERLYRVFHSSSSRSYDDFSFGERNGHRYGKRDDVKRKSSEERNYHCSTERDKRKRHSDDYNERHGKRYKKSSRDHSHDRKSHKKDKHRSKDRHKDKYYERKHKSRDRDRSSERHSSKYSDRKRKLKNKEY